MRELTQNNRLTLSEAKRIVHCSAYGSGIDVSDPEDEIVENMTTEGVGVVEGIGRDTVLVSARTLAGRSWRAKLDAQQWIAHLIINPTKHRNERAVFLRELMI